MTSIKEIEEIEKSQKSKLKQHKNDLKYDKIEGEFDEKPTRNKYVVCTQCQTCIFMQKENELWGCKLNLLSKIIKQGYKQEVIEDDKDKIYQIMGKACLFFRTKLWANKNNLNSFSEQKKYAEEEVRLKIATVIYFNKKNTLNELLLTIKSIENGLFQPDHIYILNHSDIKPSRLVALCQTHMEIPWTIESIIDKEKSIKEILDLVYKRVKKEIYISVLIAGYEVPNNYYDKLNNIIYRDMERILLIIPVNSNINRIFFLRYLAKNIGYNNDDCMIEKIKRVAKKQNCLQMVKKDEEIFNDQISS